VHDEVQTSERKDVQYPLSSAWVRSFRTPRAACFAWYTRSIHHSYLRSIYRDVMVSASRVRRSAAISCSIYQSCASEQSQVYLPSPATEQPVSYYPNLIEAAELHAFAAGMHRELDMHYGLYIVRTFVWVCGYACWCGIPSQISTIVDTISNFSHAVFE
jgi:hypothetical protein